MCEIRYGKTLRSEILKMLMYSNELIVKKMYGSASCRRLTWSQFAVIVRQSKTVPKKQKNNLAQTNSERQSGGIFPCLTEKRQRVEKETKTTERNSRGEKNKMAGILRLQHLDDPTKHAHWQSLRQLPFFFHTPV